MIAFDLFGITSYLYELFSETVEIISVPCR
jgi:hypothetical protein